MKIKKACLGLFMILLLQLVGCATNEQQEQETEGDEVLSPSLGVPYSIGPSEPPDPSSSPSGPPPPSSNLYTDEQAVTEVEEIEFSLPIEVKAEFKY
jgi:hypothetical protein